MFVRRGPAIVLSLALGAAALSVAPALAKDGGVTKDVARDGCDANTTSHAKLKVTDLDGNTSRMQVTATVWSDDSDVWLWKLRHNGGLSDDGRARGDEDSDLAFRVRAAGRKVLYQPRAVVVHHEGVSHGSDVGSGIKAYQETNRQTLRERQDDREKQQAIGRRLKGQE